MAIVEEHPRRRFTAEEVLRMVETGILSDDEPLELLDKAERYARAGVETYWLLDLPARRLELFTGPTPEGRFTEHRVLESSDTVTVPGTAVELPVAELFA